MNEQQYHEIINRNICLTCFGKGYIVEGTKSMIEVCNKCFGSGKRFQNQLKDGILE